MGFFLSPLLTAKNNPLHNPGLWNNLHRSGMYKGVISISINDKSYRLQMSNIEIQNEQQYVYIQDI